MLSIAEKPLKDIWIISLIDHRIRGSWVTGITLTLLAIVTGFSLELIPWQQSDWLLMDNRSLSSELAPPAFPIEFALMGLILSLSYLFAKNGVADLELLQKLNPQTKLSSVTKRRLLALQLSLSIFFFLLLKTSDLWLYYNTYHSYGVTEFTLADAAIAPFYMGVERILHVVLSHGILAVCWAVLVTVIWHHSSRLNEFARSVSVNLMDFSDYATVSNAVVRLFVTVGILLSFFPVASLIIYQSIRGIVFVHIALVAGGSLPLILMLSRSVRIIHSRVRKTKNHELKKIRALMTGKNSGDDTNLLGGVVSPENGTELLTYQMFVESRWEWPIAPHIQKLLLFGLLPPVTWVLSAIIENLLY